jgi:4-hydroxybenzoate polyprenyltransferase
MIRPYLELVRFSHTLFALPFALLSAVWAWTTIDEFRWRDLVGILACMVFARSAAMAFNRLVDRRIDAGNPRTARRHLPAGLLSVPAVTAFTVICSVGFVASCAIFMQRPTPNPWPLYLSLPVLCFLLGYSLAKRFTSLAHYWLGLALMLAPLAAWIAIVGLRQLEAPALLGAAVFFWVGGFDILYACQDAEYDRGAKLHSIPARLGVARSLRVAAFSHALVIPLLALLPRVLPLLGPIWYLAVVAVSLLLFIEHRLVRPDDLTRVNAAFFQVNAIISLGLLIAGAIDALV